MAFFTPQLKLRFKMSRLNPRWMSTYRCTFLSRPSKKLIIQTHSEEIHGGMVIPSLGLKEVERQHVIQILGQTNWRIRGKNGAAEILGLKPTTLETRLIKLGIRRPKKTEL